MTAISEFAKQQIKFWEQSARESKVNFKITDLVRNYWYARKLPQTTMPWASVRRRPTIDQVINEQCGITLTDSEKAARELIGTLAMCNVQTRDPSERARDLRRCTLLHELLEAAADAPEHDYVGDVPCITMRRAAHARKWALRLMKQWGMK